jgi:ferredoxin-NADP reductase
MALLENSLLIIGIAMCALALLPLAFWSVQSWAALRHNQLQFRESQRLLRQQILNANVHRSQTPEAPRSDDTHAAANQITPKAASPVPHPIVANEVTPAEDTRAAVLADGTWKGFRKFRVQKLVKETLTCTSVYLEPVDEKPIAHFQSGQHLTLRFQIPGQPKPVIRCYSLSDGPGKPCYRITVKAIAAEQPGVVSNFINDHLQQGDVIESKAPAGSFCLDLNDSRPIVMLAGGIGVTPMISMIDSILNHSPNRLAILLYGVRDKSELAFVEELRRTKETNKNLHVVYCVSAPSPDDGQDKGYQVEGRVSIELIQQLLPHNDCQFYLCGPSTFMQTLGEGLKEWGVPDDHVHSEAFGPSSISKSRSAPTVPEVAGAIEVAFTQSNQTVKWDPNCESLLELAESNGINIDFGCRAGSCGTCATELLAGDVTYPEDLQVDCEPGQCLTCVARPVGSIKLGTLP